MKPLSSLTDDEFDHALRRAVVALPDPPAAMQRAAIDLFTPAAQALLTQQGPVQGGSVQGALQALRQRLEAVLSFDSWATPALAAGMRGADSSARYLLYSVQGRDIDLRITPAASEFSLAGQILGPDGAGQVELVSTLDDDAAWTVELDDMGEFHIDGVRPGSYRFTLQVGGDEIVLPSIEVGARRI